MAQGPVLADFETVKKELASNLIIQGCTINSGKEMNNRFEELKSLVLSLEEDFAKFYQKSNKAAGTRVRKGMQDLKNLAQDIRVEVQNSKND
jgi:hypothetical protein